MKKVVVLGSTGSVGKNVLNVIREYPDKFEVVALSSNDNAELLYRQIREFRPLAAALSRQAVWSKIKGRSGLKTEMLFGEEGLKRLAVMKEADVVVCAISGRASLRPLVSSVSAGKRIALASKEPIVSAGEFIMRIARENGAEILPVDSEHSAVMQCLSGRKKEEVRTVYLTGSGGSLRGKSKKEISQVSIDDVLRHPKWKMGKKITVDSATLMNKGLEVIEARWLFDIHESKIDVVIHPEAIIHSMVEYIDGTVTAGLFEPDMRFPILRALSSPNIYASSLPRIKFAELGKLTFEGPDKVKFPALKMAYDALNAGGTMPAVMNGANEAAVRAFLEGKINFVEIVRIVKRIMDKHKINRRPSLEDIIQAEDLAAEEVRASC